jgi:hypothetical protein
MVKRSRIRTLTAFGFILFVSLARTHAQTFEPPQTADAVDAVQMTISENGLIKPGVPSLRVVFRNVVDHDVNINLGEIGGYSPRPCKLDNREMSCTFNFKLNVSDRNGATRTYTLRGMSFVAGRLDPYIIFLRAHSSYMLELGLDQFWSPATHEYQSLVLAPGSYKLSLEFDGHESEFINRKDPHFAKMTVWKGKIISNSLSLTVAQKAQPNKSLHASRMSGHLIDNLRVS